MVERIQLSRRKGWRKPECAITVARGTVYGNPFRVIGNSVAGVQWEAARSGWGSRVVRATEQERVYFSSSDHASAVKEAVDLYRMLLSVSDRDEPNRFEGWIARLRGRDLACWCPLDQPCHADVLLEIANAPDTPWDDHGIYDELPRVLVDSRS